MTNPIKKKLTIIPNDGVVVKDNTIFVSDILISNSFYIEIIQNEINSQIISLEIQNQQSKEWSFENSKFISLGKYQINKLNKLIQYSKIAFKSLFIDFSDFNYLFFPGNIPLLLSIGLLLRKKSYGVYLRGEIRYKNPIMNHFSKTVLKNAKFIIATGKANSIFAQEYNRNVEEVIPMMNVKKDSLFKKENFNITSSINILFFSRAERDKGIFESIESIKKLIDNGYDINFNIAGGGDSVTIQKIESEINGYENRIKIIGKIVGIDAISEMFKKTDIYIFPSYHEGFPRVLYEAMSFSIPIVTTDISGTKYTMIHEENCLKVKPKNSKELLNAIERLINDSELRKKIGTNSYQFMVNFFEKIENKTHAKQVLEKFGVL
ncbi:glycosyltransferase [bacterium]|nr:glycosyltransferase [bacterium]